MGHLFIYMTAPDRGTARNIARILVRERLAACANIVDTVESVYWWHGVLEEANECVCIFKTTAKRFAALEKRIRELHPYETPCIVALPVVFGSLPYLRWIEEETEEAPVCTADS